MQARKYIRFDSTQELRVCAMSVKRADYRIIARAQAPDRSMTRRLAQHARLRPNPNAWSPSPAHGAALVCMRNPALLIFSAYLQGSRHRERAQLLIRAKPSQASQALREAKRLPPASVSNRNDAQAVRNRIFLHRRYHIFVVWPLQTRGSARESRCDLSDSARLIRFEVRRQAASSALRSPLGDWLCPRSTSSPDRRTSPTFRASIVPARPSPDWQR